MNTKIKAGYIWKQILCVSVALILISVAVDGFASANIVSNEPIVSISPNNVTVQRNDTFTVDIEINPNNTATYAAQYDLYFNTGILEVTSQEEGNFLSQDGKSTFVANNEYDNELGIVSYGETRIGVQTGVTGPGILASITFHVKLAAPLDNTSDLILSYVLLSDTNGIEIPNIVVNNGTVTIPAPPTLTITSPVEGQVVNLSVIEWQAGGDLSNANYTVLNLDNVTDISSLSLSGNHTFQADDGDHTVEAWLAYDNDTKLSNPEAYDIVNFTVDTVPPSVKIDSPANGTFVNVSSLDINGNATDDSGIITECFEHWYESGNHTEDVAIDNLTSVNINISVDLYEGLNRITFTYTDVAYNVGNASVNVTLDIIPPVITDVLNGTPTASSVTITWNTTDDPANSLVNYGINQNDLNLSKPDDSNVTAHSVTLSGLTPNTTYYYTVSSTDQAGNSNASVIISNFTTKDAPTVIIHSPPAITNDSMPLLNATFDQTVAEAWYNLDGGVNESSVNDTDNLSVTLLELSEGSHNVTVYAKDNDGNTGEATRHFLVDITVPVIYINDVTSPTNVSTQTITGTFVEDGAGIGSIVVNGTPAEVSGNNYSALNVLLNEGSNTITVVATDNAGNVKTNTTEIVLDTILPIATITYPEDNAYVKETIDLIGRATDEANFKNYSVEWKNATNINWMEIHNSSTAVEGPLATWNTTGVTGNCTIRLTVTDKASNTKTTMINVTVDNVLPTAVITEPVEGAYVSGNVSINGTADDTNFENYTVGWSNATINYSEIHNSSTALSGEFAKWNTTALTDGDYLVRLTVTDKADNKNTSEVSVIIDNTLPVLNITEPVNETIYFVDNIVRGTVIDANFESARLTVWNETHYKVSQYNLSISDNSFYKRVEYAPNQTNTLELIAMDKAGNFKNVTKVVFVENNTIQVEHNVNNNESVNINAVNETGTEIVFYSNVTVNATFTVTAITNETLMDGLNDSAFDTASDERAVGKIVEINVTGLDATNESDVQHVLVKLYYTKNDLDLDGDGTVGPGDLDEDKLFIYWCNNETSGNWTKLLKGNPDWVLDNGQVKISGEDPGHIWVDVKHLSMFGLTATALPEPEPTDDSDGVVKDNSGGGGVSGGSSAEPYRNIALKNTVRQYLTTDTPAEYTFTDELNPILGVTFTPLITKGYVNVVVEVLKDTSGLVSTAPPGIVYKNINIWVGLAGWANEQTISNAKINFNVNKNWIVENNIDPETVTLYRYDAQWTELTTTKTGDDSEKIYYSARTDGFSPFAIIAKTKEGIEVTGPGVPGETEPGAPTPTEEKKPGIPGFEAIAATGMIAAVYWMCRRRA